MSRDPEVVVAAVIERGGRVLVAQRMAGRYVGLWEFPGGKREPGEDDAGALRRELVEELAIDIHVGALMYTARAPERAIRFYRCRYVPGGRPRALGCAQFRWVLHEDLAGYEFSGPNVPVVRVLVNARAPVAEYSQGTTTEVSYGQGEASTAKQHPDGGGR